MRNVAALLAALPMLAAAQEPARPAAPPSPAQQQQAPQYAPAPQAEYAPPPPQYAPPPPHYAPQARPAPAQPGYPPPPSDPARPYVRGERERDRWYIGFGVGGGDARIETGEGTYGTDDFLGADATPVSLNFRVGATLTPKLLLGFDLTSVTASARYSTPAGRIERSLGIVNLDAVATYFPVERGLFLRGGVGISGVTSTLETPSGDASESFSGVNVLGGVGYAFWLGRAFNLTVGLDFSAQSYGGEGPDSSSFWTAGVGFDWY